MMVHMLTDAHVATKWGKKRSDRNFKRDLLNIFMLLLKPAASSVSGSAGSSFTLSQRDTWNLTIAVSNNCSACGVSL